MDSTQIVTELDLEPGTCGFMAPTYVGARGAALYFLITPDHPGRLHRLNADQVYHFYEGASLDVLFLSADGPMVHTLGRFGEDGCQPQLIVPSGTVHGSRTRGPFTLACTTSFSEQPPVPSDPTAEELATARAAGFA